MMNLVFANIISKDEKTALTEKMAGSTFKGTKNISRKHHDRISRT